MKKLIFVLAAVVIITTCNKTTKPTSINSIVGIWRVSDVSIERARMAREALRFSNNGILNLGSIKNIGFVGDKNNIKYSADIETKTLTIYKSSGEIDEKFIYRIYAPDLITLEDKNGKMGYLIQFKAEEIEAEAKLFGTWLISDISLEKAKTAENGIKFTKKGIIQSGAITNGTFVHKKDDDVRYMVDRKTKSLTTYKPSGKVDEKVIYKIVSQNIIELHFTSGKIVYLVRFIEEQ